MIIEVKNGELILASEGQEEWMLLTKLHEKLRGGEINATQRYLAVGGARNENISDVPKNVKPIGESVSVTFRV